MKAHSLLEDTSFQWDHTLSPPKNGSLKTTFLAGVSDPSEILSEQVNEVVPVYCPSYLVFVWIRVHLLMSIGLSWSNVCSLFSQSSVWYFLYLFLSFILSYSRWEEIYCGEQRINSEVWQQVEWTVLFRIWQCWTQVRKLRREYVDWDRVGLTFSSRWTRPSFSIRQRTWRVRKIWISICVLRVSLLTLCDQFL